MSPIRPENVDKYPADWPEISLRIRERAGWRCEQCGVPNDARGYREPDGTFQETTEDAYGLQVRYIRIVLTVAHLNHDPTDCRDENLKALCQRCHNRLDAPVRRAGIVERRRAANHDLFQNLASYGGGSD